MTTGTGFSVVGEPNPMDYNATMAQMEPRPSQVVEICVPAVAPPKNGLRGAGRYKTVLRRLYFDSLVRERKHTPLLVRSLTVAARKRTRSSVARRKSSIFSEPSRDREGAVPRRTRSDLRGRKLAKHVPGQRPLPRVRGAVLQQADSRRSVGAGAVYGAPLLCRMAAARSIIARPSSARPIAPRRIP